jgi:hypothetical protein
MITRRMALRRWWLGAPDVPGEQAGVLTERMCTARLSDG